jgi:hypothetical protein
MLWRGTASRVKVEVLCDRLRPEVHCIRPTPPIPSESSEGKGSL